MQFCITLAELIVRLSPFSANRLIAREEEGEGYSGGTKKNHFCGYYSVGVDDCFAVHDIKVIENEDKVFIAMPNKRLKDGTFKDVAHPINFEFRQYIESNVIEAYNNAEIEE